MNLHDLSPWRAVSWICTAVLVTSIVLSVVIAGANSVGLTDVTVTALEPAKEPVDHNVPLINRREALPDYELTIRLTKGQPIHLGAKPDNSAANGLTWHLDEPVCVSEIASIRLDEQDKFLSDAVAEVQVTDVSTTENGFRFEFRRERSVAVGLRSFFATPIGKAISGAVFLAVALMITSRT